MAKGVAWFIGDPDDEIRIQVQAHRNECSVQPSRLLVDQQPLTGRRNQPCDRRQVRVDSKQEALENRDKGNRIWACYGSFSVWLLVLSRLDVSISYAPAIYLDEATGNYLGPCRFSLRHLREKQSHLMLNQRTRSRV